MGRAHDGGDGTPPSKPNDGCALEAARWFDADCVRLSNPWLSLMVTRSLGPRIIDLRLPGQENLLAQLPEVVVPRPDGQVYHYYGGHRLWRAPERMPDTYALDDAPVEIVAGDSGLTVTQPQEPETGLQKSLHLVLAADRPRVTVTHTLSNLGTRELEAAPWAITQFRTGGTAILPQSLEDTGFLPNRSLAIWPYTDMASPAIHWAGNYIRIDSHMTTPFKIGFANPRGWMAYWLDGTLFVKHAEYEPGADYCDLGSSSECYCDRRFLELETLAPKAMLQPRASVSHVEAWDLYRENTCPCSEGEIRALAEAFGLG